MATDYVRSLFVTLRRGMAGKPMQHRRIVQALGLKVRHHCVEKPNISSIRGMLAKIPHLVIVETDRMFYLRSMKQYYEQLNRDPWVVHHSPSHVIQAEQHYQQVEEQQKQLALARQSQPAPDTAPRPRPAWPAPVTPMSMRIAQLQPAKPLATSPLLSPMLEPHLQEHMTPLPEGDATHYRPSPMGPSLSEQVYKARVHRGKMIRRYGLFSTQVAEANAQLAELTRQQAEEEERHREAVLIARHTPGPHQAKVHAGGRGARRGMLAEARQKALERLTFKEQRKQVTASGSTG